MYVSEEEIFFKCYQHAEVVLTARWEKLFSISSQAEFYLYVEAEPS